MLTSSSALTRAPSSSMQQGSSFAVPLLCVCRHAHGLAPMVDTLKGDSSDAFIPPKATQIATTASASSRSTQVVGNTSGRTGPPDDPGGGAPASLLSLLGQAERRLLARTDATTLAALAGAESTVGQAPQVWVVLGLRGGVNAPHASVRGLARWLVLATWERHDQAVALASHVQVVVGPGSAGQASNTVQATGPCALLPPQRPAQSSLLSQAHALLMSSLLRSARRSTIAPGDTPRRDGDGGSGPDGATASAAFVTAHSGVSGVAPARAPSGPARCAQPDLACCPPRADEGARRRPLQRLRGRKQRCVLLFMPRGMRGCPATDLRAGRKCVRRLPRARTLWSASSSSRAATARCARRPSKPTRWAGDSSPRCGHAWCTSHCALLWCPGGGEPYQTLAIPTPTCCRWSCTRCWGAAPQEPSTWVSLKRPSVCACVCGGEFCICLDTSVGLYPSYRVYQMSRSAKAQEQSTCILCPRAYECDHDVIAAK